MTRLARISLAEGGSLLVEAPGAAEGPVKAGRLGDVIQELPGNLQSALDSVTKAAGAVLDQLRKAGPDGVTVEFGVDLAVTAGAVLTKGSANCHLKVTMTWQKGEE
ncbi:MULTISPECIES: CU044_2847 family protein [unclassified Streptomyces]|uniref:CU044_2847 family protein n=1 Tax=unclassified Streptomyces TaxID=2593676 RepID=UPI0006AE752C|nr:MULTISPECIES: CU044_2847 family protein [unclassified Streptomyces]